MRLILVPIFITVLSGCASEAPNKGESVQGTNDTFIRVTNLVAEPPNAGSSIVRANISDLGGQNRSLSVVIKACVVGSKYINSCDEASSVTTANATIDFLDGARVTDASSNIVVPTDAVTGSIVLFDYNVAASDGLSFARWSVWLDTP